MTGGLAAWHPASRVEVGRDVVVLLLEVTMWQYGGGYGRDGRGWREGLCAMSQGSTNNHIATQRSRAPCIGRVVGEDNAGRFRNDRAVPQLQGRHHAADRGITGTGSRRFMMIGSGLHDCTDGSAQKRVMGLNRRSTDWTNCSRSWREVEPQGAKDD